MRTRFAPTPSGYLHEGNLANALLTSWLAHQLGGEIYLRIDADDSNRSRPEYTEYIHSALNALKIETQVTNTSIPNRRQYLRTQLSALPQNLIFACSCSRSDLVQRACYCRGEEITWVPNVNALRLYLDPTISIPVGEQLFNLHEHFGDVVLWRRDDIPAYHWANVIDDRDLGTTHIVRGEDLLSSTALHMYLAELMGASELAHCVYLHHSLLLDSQGNKVSKSTQANNSAPELTAPYLAWIHSEASSLAKGINITPRPF